MGKYVSIEMIINSNIIAVHQDIRMLFYESIHKSQRRIDFSFDKFNLFASLTYQKIIDDSVYFRDVWLMRKDMASPFFSHEW